MSILTVAQYRTMTQTPATTPATPPTDTDIQLALNRYTGLIVGYTGRSFSMLVRQELHDPAGPGPLQLNVYPISELHEVRVDGEIAAVDAYPVHKAAGLIQHGGAYYGKTVMVTYAAGLDPAPYEIQTTLATLVEGYLAGASGGVSTLTGARKEVVMGVASIEYGTTSQMYADYGTPYAELGPYVSVLEKYREPGML